MENYPASLPGVLNSSNSYGPQSLVKMNPLQSGPPVMRLEDDTAWEAFNVEWSFSDTEIQIFRNWHRWTLGNGSKLFEIELWVEGFDGTKNTRTHECYFMPNDPPYSVSQNGRRMHVTAQLLAIEQVTDDEAFGEQLVILANGFPDGVGEGLAGISGIVELMEVLFPG